MPTYEYTCDDCRKKVSLFFLSIRQAREEQPLCPRCGGAKLNRIVSRFATARAQATPGSGPDLSAMSDLEGGDPRALARFMRHMSDEVGQPIEPEMEGVLDRLEAGEDPEKIETDLQASEVASSAAESD